MNENDLFSHESVPGAGSPVRMLLTDSEAWGLAQLVKRLGSHNIGVRNGLGLVTPDEQEGAEPALNKLASALANAGFSPR